MIRPSLTRRILNAGIALHHWALHRAHDKVVLRQLNAHEALRQQLIVVQSETARHAEFQATATQSMQDCRESWQAMAAEMAKYPRRP